MAGSFGIQMRLLMWKNWLIKKRNVCATVFEILAPVVLALLLLIIKVTDDSKDQLDPTIYKGVPIGTEAIFRYPNTIIGYYPLNTETTNVMSYLKELSQNRTNMNSVSIMGFNNENEALSFYRLNKEMQHVICFKDVTNTSTSLPKNINVAVRPHTGDIDWRTTKTFPFRQTNTPNLQRPPYATSGVMLMEMLVSESLAKYWLDLNGNTTTLSPSFSQRRMPYPPYFSTVTVLMLETSPLLFILSFLLSVIVNTKNLVYEKEKKLKESMKLMGLKGSAYWLSWFLVMFIYLVLCMIVFIIIIGMELTNSSVFLFIVFLLCYSLAVISFCFMISSFVQKAYIGAALAGILFFAFYMPYIFINNDYENVAKPVKLAGCLLFNTAMSLAFKVMSISEGTGQGTTWSNINEPAQIGDNITFLEILLMLLFATFLQFLIAWYLDNVRPGDFGVPKPFYFCFTKSYWLGKSTESDVSPLSNIEPNEHFEKEPHDLNAGISIRGLRKKYGKKVAVDDMNLNVFEGQITVLLGHNGAGKTTTMSMLTGFIPPTSGTAMVNGYNIRQNIEGVRGSLGMCPQHDILFDVITVKEHLEFFAKLKGCTGKAIFAEIDSLIKEVGLGSKANAKSSSLSGGQKRKLSVAIALVGGSKIVILDEPSSGMDPAARRQIWTVLQNHQANRTMLLTTHYMDEADLLGDRIAIMALGTVKCCGSSLFLKKLYGAGYHLVVVKGPSCDVDQLTYLVKSHVKSSSLESIINSEVTYLLPESEIKVFPDLFRHLDDQKDVLGIDSYGTSATTMEEVFLKVGEVSEQDGETNNVVEKNSHHNGKHNGKDSNVFINPTFEGEQTQESGDNTFNTGYNKETGFALQLSRVKGLLIKKALLTWRNRIVSLVQLVLPAVFVISALEAGDVTSGKGTSPPLTFDLHPFGDTIIPYYVGDPTDAIYMNYANAYANQFSSIQNPEKVPYVASENSSYTTVNFFVEKAKVIGTADYNKRVMVGMEMSPSTNDLNVSVTAFYNGQAYHTAPTAVQMAMNAFLRFALGDSYSLQLSIDPLPMDEAAKAKDLQSASNVNGFVFGLNIVFAMTFLTAFFVSFLIKEREVGAKHMQIVSGVGPITYWLPTFVWDFINFMIPCLLLVVVFVAYSKEAYVDDGRWGISILVFVMFGWAIIPCMYLIQYAFKSPPTGVVVVIVLNIITGMGTLITILILDNPNSNTADIADILNTVFIVVFPNYNLAKSLMNMDENHKNLKQCLPELPTCGAGKKAFSFCCKEICGNLSLCYGYDENYMAIDSPGIGFNLLFMAIQGGLFFLMVLLIDYNILQRIWYLIRGSANSIESVHMENHVAEDSDVAAERQRINSSPASVLAVTDPLLLVNLVKRYGTFTAVDHTCVGVPEKECFGLLGQNGAGKTTTFKMLTGDVMLTGGNAYLKGFDVRSDIKNVQRNMGYCPQFDALIDQMTGRETLYFYARLRGVPSKNIKAVVNSLIDVLYLTPHADKLSGAYSGGNKRKLSTAIALVGDPPFIMLDEPSSGMDPKARRQLWNVLSKVRASGRTLVLTSHSMEECDALCTRIAIMVNGRFVCLGSPQHLKNKFGQGYTMIVQLGVLPDGSTAPTEPIINYFQHHFPGTRVFDHHQGYVHFQVPDTTVKLADVFSLMESIKANLNVRDYSVHQTTLEQVFLTFTHGQVIPVKEKQAGCLSRMFPCGK